MEPAGSASVRAGGPTAVTVSALMNAVDSLRQVDKVLEAYALCAKAEGFFPRSSLVQIRKAEIGLSLGLRRQALEAVSRALELEPGSAALLVHAADTLELMRDYGRAEEQLSRAVELDPANVDGALKCARLCLWSGRYEEAARRAGALLAAGGDCQPAFRIRGGAFLLLGRHEEALKDLERALSRDPKDTESHIWKGELHRRLGRIEEAKASFAKATEICPYLPLGACLNMGLIALSEGREPENFELMASWVPEAIVELRSAGPAHDPAYPGCDRARLAELLSRALEHMQGNRSLTPTFLWEGRLVEYVHYFPRNYLIQLQSTARFGDYERVLGVFDELIRETPEEGYLYSHRAEVRLWVGRYADALEDFKRARGLDEKLLWPKVGLGAAYLLLEDYPNAHKCIETAAWLASESIISTWRGELYRRLGDHERALRELGKIREPLPFRPAVWLNVALSKAALGDAPAAADILFRLRRHAPEFIADAVRAAGLENRQDPARWSQNEVLRALRSAFELMRGNRSSWMYCYVLNGRLKVIRLRDVDTARMPANLRGFSWGLYPEVQLERTSLR